MQLLSGFYHCWFWFFVYYHGKYFECVNIQSSESSKLFMVVKTS